MSLTFRWRAGSCLRSWDDEGQVAARGDDVTWGRTSASHESVKMQFFCLSRPTSETKETLSYLFP